MKRIFGFSLMKNIMQGLTPVVLLILSLALVGCVGALHSVAFEGRTEEVRALLDKGADINEIDACAGSTWDMTALGCAAWEGRIETVKLLLDKGADVNAKSSFGWTALISAAYKSGHADVAKLLIDKGADVNAKTEPGWSVLAYAASGGHADVAKLLIERGADIDTAMAKLNAESTGFKMLERFAKKREIITQTTPQTLTKEDLEKIVLSAVDKSKAKDKETKTSYAQSDIDRPAFSQTEKIMGDNDLAVIIGIEGYQSLPKSDFSYDDAKLVKEYIKALGFKERNIELLLNERATQSSIKKTVETWLPNRIKSDSKVVIYYSGHGAPEPKTGDAYIVPFDGDPNYLEDTGYSLNRLYDKLGKLQVAEVIVLLDSCFSGAGGRSVLAQGARPLVMMTTSTVLPQNMAVLSATQGSQISTSSPEKGHGVFTYYFLKALKEGKKTIAEIYEYIKPLVEDEAKQLNVQQSPSISPDVEKLKGRFSLRK